MHPNAHNKHEMHDSTDESFKDLIRKWPNKAIKLLYDHYYKALVHLAERRTNNRKVAEDIVQDVLIGIWKNSDRINWNGFRIGPYLINLVKKRAINFYHQNARIEKNFILERLQSTSASKESDLIQSEQYLTLRAVIAKMPTREKECLEMRYFNEMSLDAISQQLGISKKAVEKNLTKGLKRLRSQKHVIR